MRRVIAILGVVVLIAILGVVVLIADVVSPAAVWAQAESEPNPRLVGWSEFVADGTFQIGGGAAYATTPVVTLDSAITGATEMRFSSGAAVACGQSHTLTLVGGGLWAWGLNSNGQLGDGTTVNKLAPVRIGGGTDWVNVAGGGSHTLALKADGSLWAWGGNSYGQLGDGTTTRRTSPVRIGGDSDWVSVSCGLYHSVATKRDGSLWAWGYNTSGRLGDGTQVDRHTPIRVGEDADWVSVACGDSHTLALKADGSLWAWGENSTGRLGDGTQVDRYSPVRIGSDNDWIQIAGGGMHTEALRRDGSLWAWGENSYGRLGDGTQVDRYSPVRIGNDSDWAAVSCGNSHTAALKTSGGVWVWGNNAYGQIGDGTTSPRLAPVRVGAESDWSGVTCGAYHTVATTNAGGIWAWGRNNSGQLGDNTMVNKPTPTPTGLTAWYDWEPYAASRSWTLSGSDGTKTVRAEYRDETLTVLALSDDIVLDTGPPVTSDDGPKDWVDHAVTVTLTASDCGGSGVTLTEYKLDGAADWTTYAAPVAVAGEGMHRLSVRSYDALGRVESTKSRAVLIGAASFAIFGGSPYSTTAAVGLDSAISGAAEMRFMSVSDSVTICAGLAHTEAIRCDGTLWAWGQNNSGQLGDGTTASRLFPVRVGSDSDWSTVACGDGHTVATKYDGSLWAWGLNSRGQLGDGTTTTRLSPVRIGTDDDWASIACGAFHTVATKEDDTLWAWGDNDSGQLGVDDRAQRLNPTRVGNNANWASVACGDDHTLAVTTWGYLYGWGANDQSQVDDQDSGGVDVQEWWTPHKVGYDYDWASVACGSRYSVAVKTTGSLWAWGDNAYGQLGDGTIADRTTGPKRIGSYTDWTAVRCGEFHSTGLRSTGTLYAWGRNAEGQVGDGTTIDRRSPVSVGGDPDWTDVTCGGNHTVAVKAGEDCFAWGSNVDGQLGDGTTVGVSSPRANGFTAWTTWAPYATTRGWTLSNGDGVKTVRAEYRNELGIVCALSDDILLDTLAPSVNSSNDEVWHRGPYLVTITAQDAGSGMSGGAAAIEYSLDGGLSWQEGSEVLYRTWKRGGGSGAHELLYRATDAAGNVSQSQTATVNIDSSPPTSQDDAPETPQSVATTVHFTGSDAYSGIAGFWYSLDGGTWAQGSSVTIDAPTNHTNDGLHTIRYYAVDNAGNRQVGYNVCAVTIKTTLGSLGTRLAPASHGRLSRRR